MIDDREISALLRIISDKGTDADISGVNISRLIQLAFRHKTIYQLMVFAQCHSQFFTPEQLIKLESRSRKIAIQSLTQLHELKKLAELFNKEGIGYVCIKGPQLSRMIYGREALKESVDLDIMLTDAGQLLKVHSILQSTGYDQSNLNEYPGTLRRRVFLVGKREVHYFNRQNRCAIDMHIRPGANTYLTENRFKGFLLDLSQYDLEGTSVPVLKDEAYLVYLCYHGALHQFARLAWLMDIRAFLNLKHKALNFERIVSIACERKIEKCLFLTLRLIRDYFGNMYDVPFTAEASSKSIDALARQCKSLIGRDGSYGMSLAGRAGKFLFVMKLLKGFPAKADWIYGILIRQLIKLPLINHPVGVPPPRRGL